MSKGIAARNTTVTGQSTPGGTGACAIRSVAMKFTIVLQQRELPRVLVLGSDDRVCHPELVLDAPRLQPSDTDETGLAENLGACQQQQAKRRE